MNLNEIYKPIQSDLVKVEKALSNSLKKTNNTRVLEINNYLLDSPGKRIRPALVILCARASLPEESSFDENPSFHADLYNVAGAVELIHMASLIHDDVIDQARIRHNKSTINFKWGQEVSIALGDYLYSEAFELLSQCGNIDILKCFTHATKAMCEGELLQVCERDNLDLMKERYLIIVKKKTASLFAASCMAGVLIAGHQKYIQRALKGYGLNFGTAFQIIDDYLDLACDEETLGKSPGQDIRVGESTLPALNLLKSVPVRERKRIKTLLSKAKDRTSLQILKSRFSSSGASDETKNIVISFINSAKKEIAVLDYSTYRDGLVNLADFIAEKGFNF